MVAIPELALEWIIPEIVVTGAALLILIIEAFSRGRETRPLAGVIALVGTMAALYYTLTLWGKEIQIFHNLYTIDLYSTFFKCLFLVVALTICLLSPNYLKKQEAISGEYYALLLFGLLGMMIMASSTHLITIFIGLEVMSLAIYILCGLIRENIRSVESALKYFLLGAFATAFLLYGMAMLYSTTGLLELYEIRAYITSARFVPTLMFISAIAFLVVGFGFKIAAVPFHMWTPDVYQGAPTTITAFMATGVKAAAFAALIRIFYTGLSIYSPAWSSILWILAVVTMTAGNIIALVQEDVKRMLAYSSIAHAGFLLIALVPGEAGYLPAVLFYLVVYTFMNIGAFIVLILLEDKDCAQSDLARFTGLARRHPFLAFSLSVFLLSLLGIPPLAGFMAKFYILSAAVQAEYYFLAVIGVLNTALAAYYYLRVIMFMYFKDQLTEEKVPVPSTQLVVMVICAVAIIYLGLLPRHLIILTAMVADAFTRGL